MATGTGSMILAMRIEDHLAIERLCADFAHELDRGTAEGFAALFVQDATYTHGTRVLNGRDALLQFAQNRFANGPRTSRHVVTGLRIDFEGEDSATGISCCTTFSAAGEAPIASTVPAIVADFVDVYRRVDGVWLFAERTIYPAFKAA